ncbi:MAG: glycosyltransferase [Planctomycetes bacterium]|nr:glycosyltransferase [Planctomycetota bacterium]
MTRSRIVLNFLPIGTGGGLQNAMSFTRTLADARDRKPRCSALVRSGSPLEALCREYDIPCTSVRGSLLGRAVFECRCRSSLPSGEVCFTLFGPIIARSSGHLLNVNGCAYSNLFYPEIPYRSKLAQRTHGWIDRCRRYFTKQADYWIFETEVLRARAVELCGFPRERTGVVRMAPGAWVALEHVDEQVLAQFDRRIPTGFRFLLLSGAFWNKRIHVVPKIAQRLEVIGAGDYCFITTLPESDPYTLQVQKRFRRLGLEKRLCNLGPIPPQQVSSLIQAVDVMCTFSLLESFSNNFVEAWRMERPLVVTDADWARGSCGEAALYLDPSDAAAAAEALCGVTTSERLRNELVKQGQQQLARFPSAREKLDSYFHHIEAAIRLGPCPVSDRKRIRWPKIRAGRESDAQ